MSTDARVTQDVLQTLRDGEVGFAKAAERLAENDEAQLAAEMRRLGEERGAMADELDRMAEAYGDDLADRSTITGALHRGWMALRDMVSGSDSKSVLSVAEQGEDHALREFEKNLGEDISPELRTVLERQQAAVKAAHDIVRTHRDAA